VAHLKAKLDDRGIAYAHIDGTSIYFPGPDGEAHRADRRPAPLGEMYGARTDGVQPWAPIGDRAAEASL
jgi:hypothetical protein